MIHGEEIVSRQRQLIEIRNQRPGRVEEDLTVSTVSESFDVVKVCGPLLEFFQQFP
jgi:hypothetical protein